MKSSAHLFAVAALAAASCLKATPVPVPDTVTETAVARALSGAADAAMPAAEHEGEVYRVQGASIGSTATKMNIPLRDVPGSVAVVNGEVLRQQGANDWVSAMRNVAGAMPYRTYGGFTQSVMRGLARNDLLYLFDGVRDAATAAAGSSSPQANNSLENVERVEVLKGPQALLYGQGAVAGVINSIRKKPSSAEAYELGLTIGQFGKWRSSAGAQGLLLGSDVSYRFDAGVDDYVGFRDARESRTLVSLAFSSPLWDGAEASLFTTYEKDRYKLDVGIPADAAFGGLRPGTPLDKRYNTQNDFQTRDNGQVLLELIQRLGDWELANRASYMPNEDVYLAAETLTLAAAPSSTVTRGYLYFNTRRWPWMNNLELSGPLELLGKHKVLVGYEYQHYVQHGLGFQGGFGPGLPTPAPIDLFNPVESAAPIGVFHPNRRTVVSNSGQAAYAQDHWTLHDKVKILAGVRYDDWRRSQFLERLDQAGGNEAVLDTFSTTTAATAAPVYKAGLVLGSVAGATLYVSRSNSYFPNFKADSADGRVSFDPEVGEMLEGGFKYEGLDGRLDVNGAVFDIFKHNIMDNPPAVAGLRTYSQAGTLRSMGAELDLAWRPGRYSSLQLAYAYTDASYYSFLTDPAAPGDKTKDFTGNRPSFVPMHSATLWLSHRLPNGLGFGFGGRHTGLTYTHENNSLAMPGYTIANAALTFTRDDDEFQVNVDNLADKRDYFVSSIRSLQLYPGEPRTVSTTYRRRF